MLTQSNIYKSSHITPAHSRADVEILLEKFKVKKIVWQREDPLESALIFEKPVEGIEEPILYKVTIPFIEKEEGPKNRKTISYDAVRSYRILYHVLKHMLLNTDVGMTFEQVFAANTVVQKIGNKFYNVMDKMAETLASGNNPQRKIPFGLDER